MKKCIVIVTWDPNTYVNKSGVEYHLMELNLELDYDTILNEIGDRIKDYMFTDCKWYEITKEH
jgi:hypothetical protein